MHDDGLGNLNRTGMQRHEPVMQAGHGAAETQAPRRALDEPHDTHALRREEAESGQRNRQQRQRSPRRRKLAGCQQRHDGQGRNQVGRLRRGFAGQVGGGAGGGIGRAHSGVARQHARRGDAAAEAAEREQSVQCLAHPSHAQHQADARARFREKQPPAVTGNRQLGAMHQKCGRQRRQAAPHCGADAGRAPPKHHAGGGYQRHRQEEAGDRSQGGAALCQCFAHRTAHWRERRLVRRPNMVPPANPLAPLVVEPRPALRQTAAIA